LEGQGLSYDVGWRQRRRRPDRWLLLSVFCSASHQFFSRPALILLCLRCRLQRTERAGCVLGQGQGLVRGVVYRWARDGDGGGFAWCRFRWFRWCVLFVLFAVVGVVPVFLRADCGGLSVPDVCWDRAKAWCEVWARDGDGGGFAWCQFRWPSQPTVSPVRTFFGVSWCASFLRPACLHYPRVARVAAVI
jgi:hypothetical protein